MLGKVPRESLPLRQLLCCRLLLWTARFWLEPLRLCVVLFRTLSLRAGGSNLLPLLQDWRWWCVRPLLGPLLLSLLVLIMISRGRLLGTSSPGTLGTVRTVVPPLRSGSRCAAEVSGTYCVELCCLLLFSLVRVRARRLDSGGGFPFFEQAGGGVLPSLGRPRGY